MANENTTKWDSGHVIVPVLHPDSGEVHNIAVPEDTDLKDLHSALSDAGYEHPALNAAIDAHREQPDPMDSIEHSPDFIASSKRIFDMTNQGKDKSEAAALSQNNGPAKIIANQWADSPSGGKQMHTGDIDLDTTTALNHVHPMPIGLPQLSPKDIETMQNLSKLAGHPIGVFAVSKDGLWTVDKDNKPYRVFSGTDWMQRDFKADENYNKGIDPNGFTIRVTLKNGKEITIPTGSADKYPLDAMNDLRKKGNKDIDPKQIKNIQAFSKGELTPKKLE